MGAQVWRREDTGTSSVAAPQGTAAPSGKLLADPVTRTMAGPSQRNQHQGPSGQMLQQQSQQQQQQPSHSRDATCTGQQQQQPPKTRAPPPSLQTPVTAAAGPLAGPGPGPAAARTAGQPGPSRQPAQHAGGVERATNGTKAAPPLSGPPLKRAKIDNTAANLEAKKREMEELRRKIEQAEEEEKRKRAKLQAEQEARETAARQQAEKQRRTAQLRKGLGSLAANAPAMPTPSDLGGPSTSSGPTGGEQQQQQPAKAVLDVADATEIARVLEAKSDHQCLRLHVGAPLSQVNKAYKALSLMLHPDKCSLEGAQQAWQRVKQARDNLARSA